MFDCDQDGVLNLMEVQHVLTCIGFRGNVEQAEAMVAEVSVDKTHFSLSFNEFMTLISKQRRADVTGNALLDAFL